MPHMSPMLWTFIMFSSIFLLMIMSSLLYFHLNLNLPTTLKIKKPKMAKTWTW
uniref:ATP synthase F0 subunit 8 n=1 Tax=Scalpellum stearnsi TaxID=748153 RepID=UPI00286D3B7E|nr:ATP synthase F0 subunit 8 [Scalpellum stearnsi]WKB17942.1 ATP synthase F0 subunit 8 [Scalpellum stearnsi]